MRAVFFGTLLFSTAVLCLGADPRTELEHRIDRVIRASPLADRSLLGVQVVDLKSGATVFSRNDGRLFLPASNMKLFTTALALERLGPDYRFTTKLVQESTGDLVLAGSGDPSLSGRAYPYRKGQDPDSPLKAVERLADAAVAAGLTYVAGDVVGDDRLYPWVPYPENWTQDDVIRDYGAPVSALSVADNIVTVTVHPGVQGDDLAVLSLSPAVEYFAIDNRIRTVGKGGGAKVEIWRAAGSRQLILTGTMPLGSAAIHETLAVDDPALFAACALYEALLARGVRIQGSPVARHRLASDSFEPVAGATLAILTSPPMAELLQVVDKVSQNLHAELMLRETGRVKGAGATREAGLDVLFDFLKEAGAPAEDFRMDDGSGLSRNAEVTPRLVARLLTYMNGSSNRERWLALLPVGGEDGTLAHRLCCVSDAKLVRAKTGTLARAIALSGYADSRSNGRLAFSILVNNFNAPASAVQAWVDKIALALVE